MKFPEAILFCITGLLFSCETKQQTVHAGTERKQNATRSSKLYSEPVKFSDTVKMVRIEQGSFVPQYGKKNRPVKVEEFLMDVHPVTNRQFLLFVKNNHGWRRSQVKAVYADKNYLSNWINDSTLAPEQNPDAPVTNVSWFAANAYCSCAGKQLPAVNQWEYAAMADADTKDARKEKAFSQYVVSWYEKPQTFNMPVEHTFKNYWGVWDLHGLVWEWTYDFNEIMISGESRRDVSNDENKFCGSGSVNAADLMDYAAFMRYAFRGSMKASYAVQNQGFRCIKTSK